MVGGIKPPYIVDMYNRKFIREQAVFAGNTQPGQEGETRGVRLYEGGTGLCIYSTNEIHDTVKISGQLNVRVIPYMRRNT